MKKVLLTLTIVLAIVCCYGQDPDFSKDVSSAQNVLDAYYECVSGPIGKPRQFDRMRNLFHPGARLIYSYWNQDQSKNSLMIMSLEDMIGKLGYTVEKGFTEKEIANSVHSFSSITQVFSTYKFSTEDNTISGQGITSYELVYDGQRYWIISMLWTAENEKYKIPEKYLR